MRTALSFSVSLLLIVVLVGVKSMTESSDPFRCVEVTGNILLDGKPLSGATVVFTPASGKRSSVGCTGPDGSFELVYSSTKRGALPGKHFVTVMTAGWREQTLGSNERVPLRYRENPSELTAEINNESNHISLELVTTAEDADELKIYNEQLDAMHAESEEYYEEDYEAELDYSKLPKQLEVEILE